jgi:hypothetical protein
MSCPLEAPGALERLLERKQSEEERKVTIEHFERPCESCLAQLEGADGLRILEAIGGQAAVLSEVEADRSYRAATRGNVAGEKQPTRVWRWLFGVGGGFGVAVAAAMALVALRIPLLESGRDKGAQPIAVQLRLFAASRDSGSGGGPGRVRPLGEHGALEREELLLFRYRLPAPGVLYLWVETDRMRELLFQSDAVLAAGEAELARADQALALDPARIEAASRRASFVLIASPERLVDPKASLDAAICKGCGRARIDVELGDR